jgi:hypothetical protein
MSKKASKAANNLDAFRAAHDPNVTVPTKFREGFASLLKEKGAGAWEYEGDFVKRAKLSQTELGKFRTQFEAHVVDTRGKAAKRAWFADVDDAAKMREAIS